MTTYRIKTSPSFRIQRKNLSNIPPSIRTPNRELNLDVSLIKLYDSVDHCNEELSNRNTAIKILNDKIKALTKDNAILKNQVEQQRSLESDIDEIAKLFHPGSGSYKKSRKKRNKKKKSKRRKAK